MRSGSKRSAARPPELAAWQWRALDVVAASPLRPELVFGGGAALAALHLHHRTSEDLDFFTMRPLEPTELTPLVRALRSPGTVCEVEVVGPRTSVVFSSRTATTGRIDFAFYPFDPVGKRGTWRSLTVESFDDMAVNKLQAVLTRAQSRDFVDLYFLLREGPIRDLDRLLELARAKFDAGPHRIGLAARLLLVRDLPELPQMLRRVTHRELVRFFEAHARAIARTEVMDPGAAARIKPRGGEPRGRPRAAARGPRRRR